MISNANRTSFKLNIVLCFAIDTMQENNVERSFPKNMSIYVPNLVTHTTSNLRFI